MTKLHKNPMLDEYAFKLIDEMSELKVEVRNNQMAITNAISRISAIVECLHDLKVDFENDDLEDMYT